MVALLSEIKELSCYRKDEIRFNMPDEYSNKIHALSEKQIEQKITIEKDIVRLEQSISSINAKINDDIKQEIWDIKQNIKNISQNSQDIAVLNAQFKGLEKLFETQKEIIKQRDDKWYKNFSLWISIFALVISIAYGYLNYTKPTNSIQVSGDSNVSSNNKK